MDEKETKMFRNMCEKKIAELYSLNMKVNANYRVHDLKFCKFNKFQIIILDKVEKCVDSSDSIQNMDLSQLKVHAGRLDYLLSELRKMEYTIRFNLQLHTCYLNGLMETFPDYLKELTKYDKKLAYIFSTYTKLDRILPNTSHTYSVSCFKKPSRVRFSIPE